MSAKPELSLLPSAMDAAIRRMEEDTHIIRGLRKQNERLKEELLNAQLEASLEIAKHKFAAAQAFQRMKAVEDDLNALRNWIAGNVVQNDDEYKAMRSNVSYLMGQA
jgi:microsomal dipeptidase-like Zn-dependent dipeptidase